MWQFVSNEAERINHPGDLLQQHFAQPHFGFQGYKNSSTIVMEIKSKTAAPCYSHSYSNWNLVQKHTNIQCQTHSSKILVILKPQRPMPRVPVCSLPLSLLFFIYCFISRGLDSTVSPGQLSSLKASRPRMGRCPHCTHHFAQRNSCDEEAVEKQPWTKCCQDPEEEIRIRARFWICNREQSRASLRCFLNSRALLPSTGEKRNKFKLPNLDVHPQRESLAPR